VGGTGGPRTGNSSGRLPGNSSGQGDSPGSCTGGGTSGRGLPGGDSCGGSVGWPGVAGGILGGSIGIYIAILVLADVRARDNGAEPAMFRAATAGTLSLGRVAYRFDVVAVGIEHKGAVVIRVIMGADAGRAIIAPAGR
jgi:hypothetical protein